MLIIGSKKYGGVNIDNVLDDYDSNIRFNFGLPNNNNGTKYHTVIYNKEIKNYIISKKDINNKRINNDNLYLFKIDKNKFNNIYFRPINMNNIKNIYNKYLDKIGIIDKFQGMPTIGTQGIYLSLLLNNQPHLFGFSLYDDETIKPYYSTDINQDNNIDLINYHHFLSQKKIIRKLHEKNIIDCSLSMILDNPNMIIFNIINIKPTIDCISKILQYNKFCVLKFFKNTELEDLIKFYGSNISYNKIYRNNNLYININDEEKYNYKIIIITKKINNGEYQKIQNEFIKLNINIEENEINDKNVFIFNKINFIETINIENIETLNIDININDIKFINKINSSLILKKLNYNIFLYTNLISNIKITRYISNLNKKDTLNNFPIF
jgi:hypothetical protein